MKRVLKLWAANKIRIVRSLFNKREQELRNLSGLPRYTKGEFTWDETKLQFPDAASFVFTYKEVFGKEIYRFETSNKTPLIIDCGANIGLSVIYFKILHPGARVIAFEPERSIFGYLQQNTGALKLAGIELINKAVWKQDEVLVFNNEGADASRISSLHEGDSFASSYEVEAVRLSGFLQQEVDLLKLDIEGAEIEVMKEIEPRLKNVKRVFIEYHSFDDTPQELDTILAILTRNGFHYYIDAPNPTRTMPFIDKTTFLSFDFFLNIYAIQNTVKQ